jgi:nucleotide-binding universal stress UspA family protein
MNEPTSTTAKCVVVGFDASQDSMAALEAAREQAGEAGQLIVVHAYGVPPEFLGWAEYDQLVSARQLEARRLLDELERDHADSLGDTYEIDLIGGPPAQALVDVARARHADLIVVGSRGLGAVRGMLGSVSQRLLQLTDTPVLVIPPAAD